MDYKNLQGFLKMIPVFLFANFILGTVSVSSSENEILYIIGGSATSDEHPMVVDPKNENIFYSKIIIPKRSRYEYFLDSSNNYFIIIQSTTNSVKIFYNDIFTKKMVNPIYFENYKQHHYTFRFSTWSQPMDSLCMTAFIWDDQFLYRKLIFTCIKFKNGKYTERKIDLSNYFDCDIGIWSISDKVFIIGHTTEKAALSHEPPNESVVIDLNNFSVRRIKIPLSDFEIKGNFDNNHLAIIDSTNIYSYNLKKIKRISKKPKGLRKIFGKSIDGKGYYAELVINRFFYENHVIASIPNNSGNRKILFKGNYLGDLRSSCIAKQKFVSE